MSGRMQRQDTRSYILVMRDIPGRCMMDIIQALTGVADIVAWEGNMSWDNMQGHLQAFQGDCHAVKAMASLFNPGSPFSNRAAGFRLTRARALRDNSATLTIEYREPYRKVAKALRAHFAYLIQREMDLIIYDVEGTDNDVLGG